mmetsp:Transcript_61990/g.100262  ORF Transcript_61990/g.100262 Transcript_61990/m.100262 type:complete len:186 (+) Transcript_61990:29-586(+)
MTVVDDVLTLVALDHGSTNGTFVNKKRLEKLVGLTMPVAEVSYMAFGDCENGYRFLLPGKETSGEEKSQSQAGSAGGQSSGSGSEASEPSQSSGEKRTRPKGADEQGSRKERRAAADKATKEGGSTENGATKGKVADKSRSSWRSSDREAFGDKVDQKAQKSGTEKAKVKQLSDADAIDWPEDWK